MTVERQIQSVIDRGKGNCFATCLAMILGIPAENVPNFVGDHGYEWQKPCQEWLGKRGLFMLRVRMAKEILTGDDIRFHGVPDGVWCIGTGKSPRGEHFHSVVGTITDGINFKCIHDPHPSGLGIDGWPVSIEFLVALDMQAIAQKVDG